MVYVISDLHGYPLEKVKDLFKEAVLTEEDDCFVLGDVIDRGEDGVKTLTYLMDQPNVELILGNHEAMMLSCAFLFDRKRKEARSALTAHQSALLDHWLSNGAEPTIRALSALKREQIGDILDYLSEAPLYEVVEVCGKEYLLTHSGIDHFKKGKKLSSYAPDDFLWNRPALDTKYFDKATVVFGHTPTYSYGAEYRGKPIFADSYINIDAGAAAGLPPILLRLDDLKVFTAK